LNSVSAENIVCEQELEWKRAFSAGFCQNDGFRAQNMVFESQHR